MKIEISIPNEIAERAEYITHISNTKNDRFGFRLYDSDDFSCMHIFEKVFDMEIGEELSGIIIARVCEYIHKVKTDEKK